MEHSRHSDSGGDQGNHQSHHAHMVADFRRRFWVSLILSIPILVLAPLIQGILGLKDALAFPGDSYIQFGLATVVFFYGGWPFLKGLLDELKKKEPGMMTLIGLAVMVAYVYSSMVVFGLPEIERSTTRALRISKPLQEKGQEPRSKARKSR